MNPLLKDLIKKNSNKVICDIGCGCGRNLFYSCKYSKYVTGIDISDKSLEIAKKNINCSSLKLVNIYCNYFIITEIDRTSKF